MLDFTAPLNLGDLNDAEREVSLIRALISIVNLLVERFFNPKRSAGDRLRLFDFGTHVYHRHWKGRPVLVALKLVAVSVFWAFCRGFTSRADIRGR